MKKLNLYTIDDDYINYLRKFDKVVPYNKSETRPFVGIAYLVDGITYFAPLSSPKQKHLRIKEWAIDVFMLDHGKLGIVNINNMIPAPNQVLHELLPLVKDEKYKNLLNDQLDFLNLHRNELMKKVRHFYQQYTKGYLTDNVYSRTCNFKLLNEKYSEYI